MPTIRELILGQASPPRWIRVGGVRLNAADISIIVPWCDDQIAITSRWGSDFWVRFRTQHERDRWLVEHPQFSR